MNARKDLMESSLKMEKCYKFIKIKEHERNYATHDLELVSNFECHGDKMDGIFK